jgi:hypothetical protein
MIGGLEDESFNTCPAVTVVFRSSNYRALIDSGCSLSCIRYSLLETGTAYEETSLPYTYTAHGEKILIEGEVDITLSIGERDISLRCNIVKDLCYPLILGVNWLKEEKVTLDFHSGEVFFGENPRQSLPFTMTV